MLSLLLLPADGILGILFSPGGGGNCRSKKKEMTHTKGVKNLYKITNIIIISQKKYIGPTKIEIPSPQLQLMFTSTEVCGLGLFCESLAT